jgi:2-phospho-L-lactate/phosphoenolpyruvate guanylyltransferase
MGCSSTAHAIVALKHPDRAKTRLSVSISERARRALYFRMAEHVLTTLLRARGIERVSVATTSVEVARFAQALGASAVDLCNELGTRAAYQEAIAKLRPQSGVLLINGDLPLLQPADVELLLSSPDAVCIAPDRYGSGTNALWCGTPGSIEPLFGESSFARHYAAVRAAGGMPRVVKTLGLGWDVDEPDDLVPFGHRDVGGTGRSAGRGTVTRYTGSRSAGGLDPAARLMTPEPEDGQRPQQRQ